MFNMPNINLGVISATNNRYDKNESDFLKEKLCSELRSQDIRVTECKTQATEEIEALKALSELKDANALVIFLCNYNNESVVSVLAQKFDGPVMIVGAKDENKERIQGDRRDTLSSVIAISYNLALRNIKAYIPDKPVTNIKGIIEQIKDFINIARVYISVKKLKIISFGSRPYNIYTCHSPIKSLFDIGIELEENNDLDLLKSYSNHLDDPRIMEVAQEIIEEIGKDNAKPELVAKFAAYELTLLDWFIARRGASKYAIFSVNCNSSIITELGFSPCYVHSRLSNKGIPVACDNDIYGVLSNYIVQSAYDRPSAILNINNNVPKDIYKELTTNYKNSDLFIGLNCCSMPTSLMKNYALSFKLFDQVANSETLGTLKGNIISSDITLFRLMPSLKNELQAYIVEGESLDYELDLQGCSGIIAIEGMSKFLKEVIINKNFNQHATIAFTHIKNIINKALQLLSIDNIYVNN